MALHDIALVPGYETEKNQLVLTSEIAAELFRCSVQPQLYPNLNLCAVRAPWNNADLMKHTETSGYEPRTDHSQQALNSLPGNY